jgi:hypothetical protein
MKLRTTHFTQVAVLLGLFFLVLCSGSCLLGSLQSLNPLILACTLPFMGGSLVLSYVVIVGLRTRKEWAKLATEQGWSHHWSSATPGAVRGQLHDCIFEARRLEHVGDIGIFSSHLRIQVVLSNRFPLVATRALVEDVDSFLPSIKPSTQTTALVQSIGALSNSDLELDFVQNSIVLTSPGLSREQFLWCTDRLEALLASLERTLSTQIHHLASSRDWKLSLDPPWTAERADGYPVFRYSEDSGPLTRFELPLPPQAPQDLIITESSEGVGDLSTHDPILDEWVSIRSEEPERVRALLQQEGATEAVMSLIRGHGGEVRDGVIRVETHAFVFNPLDIWESLECLSSVLEG